ncbi:hypothetical protein H9Q10_03570 [Eikenella sp. S3360]|uniref:Uncharacterized protein n=1 Tax=Eikenella glucosivorans TaxID=2766967 RepID=A0ABS0N8Z7_9NEIS|nr:hypothetical protein [Eikenella glucosivorans]MBH5328745.1 hypothetical protein [Eikenella glucosivorans]
MHATPTQTPRPIARWRIAAHVLWALAWLVVTARFAVQQHIVLKMAALLPLVYGTVCCSTAWQMWRRRQAVLARLANPQAPKFSLRFTTTPILHSLFYAAACALIALFAARWLLRDFALSGGAAALEFLFTVVIPTAAAAVGFARGIIRARRCTYRAESDTFEIRRLRGLSWHTERRCRAANFAGIRLTSRTKRANGKANNEALWLEGKGGRVLLGKADAIRSGGPMRDLAADIFAASGLPILPDSD